MQPYEKLEAWQFAHRLTLAVYRTTKKWPKEERYALSAQVRRAAYSVAANMVEGAAKKAPPINHPSINHPSINHPAIFLPCQSSSKPIRFIAPS